MGKNLDSQHCLNHGEDNPLERPLDLIINKCSVLRDEKDTSLNFTALSARRREITGTRETPKHVKRACMRPSAGVGDEVFPCVFTMNGGEQPAKQLEGEKLQQNYAYPQPLLHKTSLYSRASSKMETTLPTAPRTCIYCVVCHKPHVEVGGRSLLLPCQSQR